MHNPGIHTSTLVSHEDSCFTDITFQAGVKMCAFSGFLCYHVTLIYKMDLKLVLLWSCTSFTGFQLVSSFSNLSNLQFWSLDKRKTITKHFLMALSGKVIEILFSGFRNCVCVHVCLCVFACACVFRDHKIDPTMLSKCRRTTSAQKNPPWNSFSISSIQVSPCSIISREIRLDQKNTGFLGFSAGKDFYWDEFYCSMEWAMHEREKKVC